MKLFPTGAPAFACAAALYLLAGAASAAMTAIDLDGNSLNGHEAVYDDLLDISWLRDANLAASQGFGVAGINADGTLNWFAAMNFVAAMNAQNGGDGYLGINSWRLPHAFPLDGNAYNTTHTDNGSSDVGYNISSPVSVPYNPAGASAGFLGSELAYSYYNNFGAIGFCNGTGVTTSAGCISNQPENVYGLDDAPDNDNNKPLFDNLINKAYWSGGELDAANVFLFSHFFGDQFSWPKADDFFHLWIVADGNIAASAVPVPAAAWFFASALVGFSGITWRRK